MGQQFPVQKTKKALKYIVARVFKFGTKFCLSAEVLLIRDTEAKDQHKVCGRHQGQEG